MDAASTNMFSLEVLTGDFCYISGLNFCFLSSFSFFALLYLFNLQTRLIYVALSFTLTSFK